MQKLQEDTCAGACFNKVASIHPATLLEKETIAQVFFVNFVKVLRTTFLKNNSRVLLLILVQSQETERQSGNTGRLNGDLCVVLKFTERPKTTGITSKNNSFPEEIKLFQSEFPANLDEKNVDMVQFRKRWNWKWIF